MRNFFIILFASFAISANAQMINQNVQYTKVAMFTGKPIVQDTALLIKNGSDTLTIAIRKDSVYFTSTTSGIQLAPGIETNFAKLTNVKTYPFLIGDSATNAGGKTFVINKSFFGLTLPTIRNGYLGDLTGLGLGDGTTYWNPDSIGAGSLVLNSINSKATAVNSQVIAGAGNSATGAYSNIIGGLQNTASGQSSLILSSSASTASDTSATIISSGSSIASADVALVIGGVSDTASGQTSAILNSSNSSAAAGFATIIGSAACSVTGNGSSIISAANSVVTGVSSGILHSTGSTVSANNSLILNSSDSHIDFDTNGNGNLIAASTLAGIDGNARLAVALGSYKSFQYGTHSISLGSAYDTTYAYHEIVIGNSAFHDPSGTSNGMVKGDMFIGIGNAQDSTEHQNCFIMIKNGNTVIGDSLNIGDKPLPSGPMLRVKGNVKVDSLLNLSTGLDSVTLYALTPTNGTLAFCNNCTGSGITGRIVAYIGAAWRRLTFE